MFMSRRTAKNLNGAGALVLACLGLALLPVPARAQQTTPDNVVPIQVQPAKKTPALDEQIEAVRRALQQLEEQKRKEQGQAAPNHPPHGSARERQYTLLPTRRECWDPSTILLQKDSDAYGIYQ